MSASLHHRFFCDAMPVNTASTSTGGACEAGADGAMSNREARDKDARKKSHSDCHAPHYGYSSTNRQTLDDALSYTRRS